MDVIDDEEDRLLASQPVKQSKDRFEQGGSLQARITEWGRGRKGEAVEEPAEIGQPFDESGPRARLDGAYDGT